MNLISIGDGDAERAASLRLQAPERKGSLGEEKQRVKSVKLIELPTCQQLIVQHEMLQVRLPDVTAFFGCLDLKSRFPSSGSPGKAAGPTLVHFGRPTGMLPVGPGSPVKVEAQAVISPRAPASPIRGVGGQLPPLGAGKAAGEAELSTGREKESGNEDSSNERPLSSRIATAEIAACLILGEWRPGTGQSSELWSWTLESARRWIWSRWEVALLVAQEAPSLGRGCRKGT